MSKAESTKKSRFYINPIEVLIASTLGGVLIHSLYQLLYQDPAGPASTALVSMKAKPTSEGRKLASAKASPLLNLELNCEKGVESATEASKARLQGQLCGLKMTDEGMRLASATITNTSNEFIATVFAQNDSNRFSTDYIPLAPGENKIRVEFSYSGGGKPFFQDVLIKKN